jgi:diacylglycerol kinase (ATP)
MRGCVILNPGAGSVDEAGALREAIKRLGDVSLQETAEPEEATRFAARAVEDGCELVVAAGGDGTINEVVNGLSHNWAQAKLGILPLGTGNDFARTIGAPTDIDAAIEAILRDECRPIDIVCAESDQTRYFVNVSSGGFSGLVDENLTDELKSAWGPLSYLRAAVASLPDLTNYHTTIQYDDEEPQQLLAYNLVIANARYVAGGVPIAPEAILDDGKVDVIVIPAASMPRLALIVPSIWLGRHLDNPDVIFRRASRLRVDAQPGMWFNTDGELVGNEPITFTVLPRALRVIVGPDIDSTVFRS